MKRIILMVSVALVVAAMMALAGPAFANHDHNLTTPGTVVVDIANGQTEKCASEPGGHKFHEGLHAGTPGTFAFNQGGQVVITKTEDATC